MPSQKLYLPLLAERTAAADSERKLSGNPGLAKFCTHCHRLKPIEMFTKDRRRKDGCQSWCRVCRQAENGRYRETEEYRVRKSARRARPEAMEKDRIRKHRYTETRKQAHARYQSTPKGKIIHCRSQARYELKRAVTDERRAALVKLIAAYDAEIVRMETRSWDATRST